MHIGVTSVMIDMPVKGDHIENFAAIINRLMFQHSQLKLVLRLTIPGDNVLAEKLFRKYMDLKQITEGCQQLSVILSVGPDLPDSGFFHKFTGEKVFAIQLCTSAFLSNHKGYPVLPASH